MWGILAENRSRMKAIVCLVALLGYAAAEMGRTTINHPVGKNSSLYVVFSCPGAKTAKINANSTLKEICSTKDTPFAFKLVNKGKTGATSGLDVSINIGKDGKECKSKVAKFSKKKTQVASNNLGAGQTANLTAAFEDYKLNQNGTRCKTVCLQVVVGRAGEMNGTTQGFFILDMGDCPAVDLEVSANFGADVLKMDNKVKNVFEADASKLFKSVTVKNLKNEGVLTSDKKLPATVVIALRRPKTTKSLEPKNNCPQGHSHLHPTDKLVATFALSKDLMKNGTWNLDADLKKIRVMMGDEKHPPICGKNITLMVVVDAVGVYRQDSDICNNFVTNEIQIDCSTELKHFKPPPQIIVDYNSHGQKAMVLVHGKEGIMAFKIQGHEIAPVPHHSLYNGKKNSMIPARILDQVHTKQDPKVCERVFKEDFKRVKMLDDKFKKQEDNAKVDSKIGMGGQRTTQPVPKPTRAGPATTQAGPKPTVAGKLEKPTNNDTKVIGVWARLSKSKYFGSKNYTIPMNLSQINDRELNVTRKISNCIDKIGAKDSKVKDAAFQYCLKFQMAFDKKQCTFPKEFLQKDGINGLGKSLQSDVRFKNRSKSDGGFMCKELSRDIGMDDQERRGCGFSAVIQEDPLLLHRLGHLHGHDNEDEKRDVRNLQDNLKRVGFNDPKEQEFAKMCESNDEEDDKKPPLAYKFEDNVLSVGIMNEMNGRRQLCLTPIAVMGCQDCKGPEDMRNDAQKYQQQQQQQVKRP